ncbi:uncharacterized protein LOC135940815 [Cloeon dipterum]|uniref:uncharacterized protein LOC135940815 n=1 Tax=Cloeon dipterum TaxID=197152 RepID=UPI00321FF0BD
MEGPERGGSFRKKASLGYFEWTENDEIKKQIADNVWVLVLHYDFKNSKDKDDIRHGDTEDVTNLRNTFEKNRNCKFKSFLSMKRDILLRMLSDDNNALFRIFESKDDVPSVFLIYFLSHGHIEGEIYTDHYEDENSDKYISFTTTEVFESLSKLTRFEKCLKIVNFGPCRGKLFDKTFSPEQTFQDFNNRNSCQITSFPQMRNLVVFYATVETIRAMRDKEVGTTFVRHICQVLNSMEKSELLINVLTLIQSKIHGSFNGIDMKNIIRQTPEIKFFGLDSKFIISSGRTSSTTNDSSSSDSTGSIKPGIPAAMKGPAEIYPWKSRSGQYMRRRLAFIFYSMADDGVTLINNALSQNLNFETDMEVLSKETLELYCEDASKVDSNVGCVLTCVFGRLSENPEQKEMCVLMDQTEVAVTDIVHSFIGPANDKWIGKPKIFIFVDQEASPKGDNASDFSYNYFRLLFTTLGVFVITIFYKIMKILKNHTRKIDFRFRPRTYMTSKLPTTVAGLF